MDSGLSHSKKAKRMPDDMMLNDSVSGVSRSGRVRKKSAKLMEMEDYHTPSFEMDYSGETPKGGRKRPPVPTKLVSPPCSVGSPHQSPPYTAPDALKTPTSTVAASSKRKTPFATAPPIANLQPKTPASRKPLPNVANPVVAPQPLPPPPPAPPVGRSRNNERVIVQSEPPSQSFEALSGNPSCYLMGDDIHFITGEPISSMPDERHLMPPLKVDIGGVDHHNVSMHDDNAGLKMKFILSPKVGGSQGPAKPETAGKRKGVTARRNPADLMSRPPAKKPTKSPARASPKSPARKKPAAGSRKQTPPAAITALDVLAAGGIPPLDTDLSSADFSDDDELGNSLVIAERMPKQFDQSGKSSRPGGKSKAKLSSSKMPKQGDQMTDDMSAVATNDGSMQQQSLYLKEKLSSKKKSGKKVVKQKEEGNSEKKPRPVSAYMLFCKEHRQRLLSENNNLDFATLSRKLGEIWKSMLDSEKSKWRRKANSLPIKHAALVKSSGGKMLDSRKQKVPAAGQGKHQQQQQQHWGNSRIQDELQSASKENARAVSTTPLDVAAYLKLLGESLSIIGQRLTEHEGQIAVSGSLSVLLDSTLCALGPLLCLSSEVPQMDGCPKMTQESILDNIAYIMPGL